MMKRALHKERDQEICNLYLQGWGQSDIGKKLSIHVHTVQRVLKTNHIPPNRKHRFRNGFGQEQERDIVESYINGTLDLEQLRNKYQVAAIRIRKILMEAGIEISKRGIHEDKHTSLRKQLYSDYMLGFSLNDLLKKYGLAYPAIRIALKLEGVPEDEIHKKKPLTPLQCKEIAALSESQSVESLAERYQCSVRRIHESIRFARNLKPNKIQIENEERNKQIIEACAVGASYKEIANRFHIQRNQIKEIERRFLKEEKDHPLYATVKARKARRNNTRDALVSTANIYGGTYNRWKANAKTRGLDLDLTIGDIQSIYEQQTGLCYYTGTQMIAPSNLNELRLARHNIRLITLERLDSSKGYIKDNVVLCCVSANLGKSDWSEKEYVDLLDETVSNRSKRIDIEAVLRTEESLVA